LARLPVSKKMRRAVVKRRNKRCVQFRNTRQGKMEQLAVTLRQINEEKLCLSEK